MDFVDVNPIETLVAGPANIDVVIFVIPHVANSYLPTVGTIGDTATKDPHGPQIRSRQTWEL